MDGLLGRVVAQIRAMSIAMRLAVLAGVAIVIGAAVAGPVADNPERLRAVLLAWGVCTVSAWGALVLSLAWHGTPNGVAGALGGMLVGLGLPLATAVAIQQIDGALAKGGFYGWIVLFYLVLLTAKTLLVAPGFAPPQSFDSSRDDDRNSPAKKSGV